MSRKVSENTSLEEIREKINRLDEERYSAEEGSETHRNIEKIILELRDAERSLIEREQKELAEKLTAFEDRVRNLSREMREKVKDQNEGHKAVDITEKVLSEALEIIRIIKDFIK